MHHLRGIVKRLPSRGFGDIAIAPFAVEDDAGRRWGLFDRTAEYGFPHAELLPNRLGFNPPWDGDFDT
jgi:formate hydrogenlyase regulatory protein HycA